MRKCYIITYCFQGKPTNIAIMNLSSVHLQAILLIVLFLFGQSVVIAHEFSHEAQAVEGSCTNCLTKAVFTDALSAGDKNLQLTKIHSTLVSFFTAFYDAPKQKTTQARAPPHFS